MRRPLARDSSFCSNVETAGLRRVLTPTHEATERRRRRVMSNICLMWRTIGLDKFCGVFREVAVVKVEGAVDCITIEDDVVGEPGVGVFRVVGSIIMV